MRFLAACLTGVSFACAMPETGSASLLAVGYRSEADLARVVDGRADVIRRIAALHVAEVHPRVPGFAAEARQSAGIRYVQPTLPRRGRVEPALFDTTSLGIPYEWQFAATHADGVPASVLRGAAGITIAVVDTGADLDAPDIAAKSPRVVNLRAGTDGRDLNGHGTFVSSLAAGSVNNGDGVAGFGGDARLLVIKASTNDGTLTDLDEAGAIVYAVDHGARIINLSVGGTETSFTERRGIQYAVDRGALIVAAAGNEYLDGNPVEYPAALLQPPGSNGRGGVGLSVGASTLDGSRAAFSNTGSQLSLVAPGDNVFGAVSSLSSPHDYPRSPLPGATAGVYGFASGTSFAAPEVAGAAALVMAANPLLRASEVATILKQTASGHGAWNPDTGFGQLDVAAAVAQARSSSGVVVTGERTGGRLRLRWYNASATRYRVTVKIDRGTTSLLFAATERTSTLVTLRRGHRYVFTVGALDAGGAVAASATYSVRG